MHFKLRLIPAATAAVLLAACGGGSNPSAQLTTANIDGYLQSSGGVNIDGYLQFSKTVCDVNDNGVADTGEPVAYSDINGKFLFVPGCNHGVVVTGGINKDTQLLFAGKLWAPVGATVVSPLTTLLTGGTTQAQVNIALGLPAGTDLLNTDPAAVSSNGALVNPELLKKTLAVQQLLQKTSETFVNLPPSPPTGGAAIEPLYKEVAAAFSKVLQTSSPLLSGTTFSEGVVKLLVAAAGDRVKTAPSVMSSIQDGIAKAGGSATLAAVVGPALKAQADTFLVLSSDATAITNGTKLLQSNTTIADAVATAVNVDKTLTETTKATDTVATNLAETLKTTTNNRPTAGVAVDGYLQFSKVVCDSNDDGVSNTGETLVYTSTAGKFTFPQGCKHGLILTGGSNADTGLLFSGLLKAPLGSTVISPLTTLVNQSLTQNELKSALGLPAALDLLTTDPAAQTSGGALINAELLKKTLVVQQLLQKVTETFVGLGQVTGGASIEPVYSEVATAFSNGLKNSASILIGSTLSTDVVVIRSLVTAAAERVMSSSTVAPVIKVAISNAGGSAVLAAVISSALKVQADAYLVSGNNAADITSVTLNRQANTAITETVKQAVAAGILTSLTKATDAAVATLATQTTSNAAASTNTGIATGVLASFDEATPAAILGFNGAEGSSIKVAPAGGSGKAVNVLRTGGDPWAGVAVITGAIPFTATRKTITARVYSPLAGVPMVLKVEDAAGAASAEIAATPTVAVGWQTLTWVVTGLDLTKTYTKVILLPKLGTISPISGDSFFFDDITLAAETVTPPTPVPSSGLLTSFDEATAPIIQGFNGAEGSSIKAGPAGGSGKAVNVLRTGGDPWAGVAVTTSAIPFTATRKTISARVYSPLSGVPMVLKVEDAAGSASAEIAATPTVAVGWQTLTWVITGLDLTKSYTKVVLLPKLGTVSPVSGDSFYFDDLTLLPEQITPPPATSNYLYLANNALSLTDGATTTSYTMAQFQSNAGINVKWPMASNAALKLNLAESGSFTLASGQTLSAAVAITQDTPAGSGEVKAYIDNVNVTKTGNSIQVTVPTTANAIVYGVSGDGKTKAIIDFANSVKGVTNTLSAAANAVSTIVLGDVVNYAVNGVSNDFTGMYALRGKYKVSIVVTNLPLRQTDGTAFGTVTIQVPTKLNATGAATTIVPVTGPGLEGYINLTN